MQEDPTTSENRSNIILCLDSLSEVWLGAAYNHTSATPEPAELVSIQNKVRIPCKTQKEKWGAKCDPYINNSKVL